LLGTASTRSGRALPVEIEILPEVARVFLKQLDLFPMG